MRWNLVACERVVLNRGSMKSVRDSMDSEGFFDEEVLMFMVRCFWVKNFTITLTRYIICFSDPL